MVAGKSLAGQWRKDDAHDPVAFAAAVAAIFTLYAPDVVQFVCDPRTGLAKKHKWPPALQEVHEACTDRIADLERVRRYSNWGEDRERAKDQGGLPPPPPEKRPTREQLLAKYGPDWGLGNTNMGAVGTFAKLPKPAWRTPEWEAEQERHNTPMKPLDSSHLPHVRQLHEPQPGMLVEEVKPILDADGNEIDQGADF
jgi:hypothetical protein